MSVYRYFTTDLVTGVMRADTLPLHVADFSRMIGGVGQPGTLSGYLDLGVLPAQTQAAYLGALEPRKTLLWVAQDNYPIWCGVLWDWPVTSVAGGQLPIGATEISSLFNKRQVRTDQVFTAADLFAVVQGLVTYAITKTNGAVSCLVVGSGTCGTTITKTIPAANLPKVLDSISQFCAENGVEYEFRPGWDVTGTVPTVTLVLGKPTLGRPVAATNLLLQYPSQYTLDYAFPRLGGASVNSLLATASNAGAAPLLSGTAHGQNAVDFANGYPLLEDSVAATATTIASQTQIDNYADGVAARMSGCTTVPSVTIGGGGQPAVGQLLLGDQANFAATSAVHPADPNTGAPGLQAVVRIIGWKVTPSDGTQVESTDLYLGGITT